MENTILHKAATRGHANHGWLDTYHTFSFANYYNPERIRFGMLRVLNDDTVAGGMGFDTHPHDNMEIISIPLEGDLEHQDSMGNISTIRKGDIQVMSAGTGILHSEYNKNKDKEVKFLQIWVFPNQKNVTPRYQQMSLDITKRINQFQQIISPSPDDDGLWIHQQAWFSITHLQTNHSLLYNLHLKGNGIYVFMISGELKINNQTLSARDGLGITNIHQLEMTALQESEILVMEIPMQKG